MSASLALIAPKSEIGVLNCLRSLAYSTAVVVILRWESKQAAANLIRPTFKAFMAILKPSPRPANIFSTGTLVSLKNTCLVEEERMPNLCSSSPKVIPLLGSFSTINPVMYLSSSIRAKTMNRLQKPALEIHIFCPLMR